MCAIISRQHCAALENPALLDREPASGGLRALRSTEALPVLIVEPMPRCASCLAYTSAASAPMCSAACFVCACGAHAATLLPWVAVALSLVPRRTLAAGALRCRRRRRVYRQGPTPRCWWLLALPRAGVYAAASRMCTSPASTPASVGRVLKRARQATPTPLPRAVLIHVRTEAPYKMP